MKPEKRFDPQTMSDSSVKRSRKSKPKESPRRPPPHSFHRAMDCALENLFAGLNRKESRDDCRVDLGHGQHAWKKGDSPLRDYELVDFRGEGEFGQLWEVSSQFGTQAMKLIPLESAAICTETHALSLLKKMPNCLELLKPTYFKEKDGWLMIVMDIGDEDAAQALAKSQKSGKVGIEPFKLRNYIMSIAIGVDALTEQNLVHRDLKPDNIVIQGGFARLSDFSLLVRLDDEAPLIIPSHDSPFVPPEFEREGPSRSSDQYSLAVSYYFLYTGGHYPFSKGRAGERKVDLSGLPPAERPIVKRMLSPKPADRFPSCVEAVEHLEEIYKGYERKVMKQFPAANALAITFVAIVAMCSAIAVGTFLDPVIRRFLD